MNLFDKEGLIDSEVQDILYELGNVGLGSASIAVGKLMGVRLHIGVPDILTMDGELAEKLTNQSENAIMIMNFQKTLNGCILFIIKESFIDRVVERMANKQGIPDEEIDKLSAVQEFTNIICAAYLKAVGQYTNMRIYVKPAGVSCMSAEDFQRQYDKAICMDTGFSVVYENGDVLDDVGHVVMLPDNESVEKLVEPLCD